MKKRPATSTLKKVVVVLSDRTSQPGYLNPSRLGQEKTFDLLSPEGEHREVSLADVRAVFFVTEFADSHELDRKVFLSRPKLDGLWVRVKFQDGDILEGVVPNDLLSLLDLGVQITPPDMRGNTLRMFIPRTALSEMTVLGVVGIARRKLAPVAAASQPKLFTD